MTKFSVSAHLARYPIQTQFNQIQININAMQTTESREHDKHEMRDLLLSIISSQADLKNLIGITNSQNSRPADEMMESIQIVSADLP